MTWGTGTLLHPDTLETWDGAVVMLHPDRLTPMYPSQAVEHIRRQSAAVWHSVLSGGSESDELVSQSNQQPAPSFAVLAMEMLDAVAAAPMLASAGLERGVQSLPLPGHSGTSWTALHDKQSALHTAVRYQTHPLQTRLESPETGPSDETRLEGRGRSESEVLLRVNELGRTGRALLNWSATMTWPARVFLLQSSRSTRIMGPGSPCPRGGEGDQADAYAPLQNEVSPQASPGASLLSDLGKGVRYQASEEGGEDAEEEEKDVEDADPPSADGRHPRMAAASAISVSADPFLRRGAARARKNATIKSESEDLLRVDELGRSGSSSQEPPKITADRATKIVDNCEENEVAEKGGAKNTPSAAAPVRERRGKWRVVAGGRQRRCVVQ